MNISRMADGTPVAPTARKPPDAHVAEMLTQWAARRWSTPGRRRYRLVERFAKGVVR